MPRTSETVLAVLVGSTLVHVYGVEQAIFRVLSAVLFALVYEAIADAWHRHKTRQR